MICVDNLFVAAYVRLLGWNVVLGICCFVYWFAVSVRCCYGFGLLCVFGCFVVSSCVECSVCVVDVLSGLILAYLGLHVCFRLWCFFGLVLR